MSERSVIERGGSITDRGAESPEEERIASRPDGSTSVRQERHTTSEIHLHLQAGPAHAEGVTHLHDISGRHSYNVRYQTRLPLLARPRCRVPARHGPVAAPAPSATAWSFVKPRIRAINVRRRIAARCPIISSQPSEKGYTRSQSLTR